MPSILTPSRGPHVHISDISKEKLATIVNEQTQRILELEAHRKHLCMLLLAIVQAPDALQVREGRVTIAKGAWEKVDDGTAITITPRGDYFELTAVPKEEKPRLVKPTILTPPAGVQ